MGKVMRGFSVMRHFFSRRMRRLLGMAVLATGLTVAVMPAAANLRVRRAFKTSAAETSAHRVGQGHKFAVWPANIRVDLKQRLDRDRSHSIAFLSRLNGLRACFRLEPRQCS